MSAGRSVPNGLHHANAAEVLTLLEVLRQPVAAFGGLGAAHDERVPPGQATSSIRAPAGSAADGGLLLGGTSQSALVQIGNHIHNMRTIHRTLAVQLASLAQRMPAVAVTGPQQSGKTTLCRAVFPRLEYVSLEPLDVRDFALSDPRGFLTRYRGGAVLDEVQRAPALFAYL